MKTSGRRGNRTASTSQTGGNVGNHRGSALWGDGRKGPYCGNYKWRTRTQFTAGRRRPACCVDRLIRHRTAARRQTLIGHAHTVVQACTVVVAAAVHECVTMAHVHRHPIACNYDLARRVHSLNRSRRTCASLDQCRTPVAQRSLPAPSATRRRRHNCL